MLVFLELTEQVSNDGRIDTIFVSLQQVAKGKLLQQAINAANLTGQLTKLQQAIVRTFEETPLKEFVDTMLG
jgi:hypothetical protein